MAGNKQLDTRVTEGLRAARRAAKLNVRQLSAKTGLSTATISRFENAIRRPEVDQVRAWMVACQAPPEQTSHLLELTERSERFPWVATTLPDHRKQTAALIRAERTATSIVEWSTHVVPGLLQTSEYARAMMARARLTEDEIENRVAMRIGRQVVLTGPHPAQFTTLIAEGVLNQLIGGPAVMVAQLRRLLDASAMPHVEVRVVPQRTDWHRGMDGDFVLIKGKIGALAHVGIPRSALIFDRQPDINLFEGAVDEILKVAMTPVESSAAIQDVISRVDAQLEDD
ncbi:helix-turn-helix domain-containing protein [Amycolatopsis aidingensis]|uniref:helix-turn-helix domain-containing protein n=1 Tax=Amycolatopsis aidingensis TaxID=2842453 RepID=UPI001C0D7F00|nr:helix-turn-helix transcriptional regulator [Amycolatopsis aidingensis]